MSSFGGDEQRLQAFLAREGVKLLVGGLERQMAVRRTVLVLLLTAGAYVVMAALGHGHRESMRKEEQELLLRERAEAASGRDRAAADQHEAFERRSEATMHAVRLSAEARLAASGPRRPEQQPAGHRQEQLEADRERQLQRSSKLRRARDAERDANAAETAVAEAEAAIAAARRRDAQSRQPWDRRNAPVPAQLQRTLIRAQQALEQKEQVLEAARRQDLEAAKPYPIPGSVSGAEPEAVARARPDLLAAAVDAEVAQLEAELAWEASARELEAAEASVADAERSLAALDQPDAALQLPVVNLPMAPTWFFRAAPWLVLVLYLWLGWERRGLLLRAAGLLAHAHQSGVAQRLVGLLPVLELVGGPWPRRLGSVMVDLLVPCALAVLLLNPEVSPVLCVVVLALAALAALSNLATMWRYAKAARCG